MGRASHFAPRATNAEELLRVSSLPIFEIALACGLVDQSHFSRVFVRVVGSGPGAWRRGARNRTT
ncbi:MAG TPA: AraC family transcriptional regulator [Hyphomicrobium sp.]|nr:AraC family transcriptional regulator [Hyphomicrobium sp.]